MNEEVLYLGDEKFNGYDLGYILKCGREDSDLSQKKVMELTGINNKTLSGYENNIAEPDFNTLMILFKLYNVSVDSLIFDEKQKDEAANEQYKMFRELPAKVKEDLTVQIKALHNKYCGKCL